MKNVFTLIAIASLMASCGSSSSSQNGGAGNNPEALVTYEIKGKSICSIDLQAFSGSEEDSNRKLCEALIDESLNKSCAHSQREIVFKMHQCSGIWPHSDGGRRVSIITKRYQYRVNGCSTGVHIVVSDNEETAMRLYCQYLADDKLNRNCANDKRAEEFAENDCKNALK